jgi:hypothetical protein
MKKSNKNNQLIFNKSIITELNTNLLLSIVGGTSDHNDTSGIVDTCTISLTSKPSNAL